MKKIINILLVILFLNLCGGCFSEKDNLDFELAKTNEEVRTGYIKVADDFEKITYIKSGKNNIFQGDIYLEDEYIYTEEYVKNNTKRGAISRPEGSRSGWAPRIRYYISSSAEFARKEIEDGVALINSTTNVVLEEGKPSLSPQTSNYGLITEKDLSYIYICKSDESGISYSTSVGNPFINGAGFIKVALFPGVDKGTVAHEFLHALGMWHEQSRQDRDNYITIYWENMKKEIKVRDRYGNLTGEVIRYLPKNTKYQFEKHGYDVGTFDIKSIMMYGPYSFSENKNYTITKKKSDGSSRPDHGMGSGYYTNSSNLSTSDIATINYLFPRERVIYKMTVGGYAISGSHKTPSIPTGYYYSGPGSLPDLKTGYTVKGKNSTLKIKSLQTDLPMYKDSYEEVVFERGIYKGESFYIDASAEKSGNGRRTFVFYDQYGNSFGTHYINFAKISDILAGNTDDGSINGCSYMGPTYNYKDKYLEFYFDGSQITYNYKTK